MARRARAVAENQVALPGVSSAGARKPPKKLPKKQPPAAAPSPVPEPEHVPKERPWRSIWPARSRAEWALKDTLADYYDAGVRGNLVSYHHALMADERRLAHVRQREREAAAERRREHLLWTAGCARDVCMIESPLSDLPPSAQCGAPSELVDIHPSEETET